MPYDDAAHDSTMHTTRQMNAGAGDADALADRDVPRKRAHDSRRRRDEKHAVLTADDDPGEGRRVIRRKRRAGRQCRNERCCKEGQFSHL